MTDRCLITGCSGFLGSHLCDFLVAQGHEVWGISRRSSAPNLAHLRGKIKHVVCDLRRRAGIRRAVSKIAPDYIFHLAVQGSVPVSWEDPIGTYEINFLGTLHVLEAAAQLTRPAKVILVSSCAVYGGSEGRISPFKETDEFRPTSPYAVSKVAAELAAEPYRLSGRLPVVIVRPFSLTGPRKRGDAASWFAGRMLAVEAGRETKMRVAPLERVRDFTDGRDAAAALALIAKSGIPGEIYNLSTGEGRNIKEVLDLVLGCARVPAPVVIDAALARQFDDTVLIGDSTRLRALGWAPRISLNKTISDLIEEMRESSRLPQSVG